MIARLRVLAALLMLAVALLPAAAWAQSVGSCVNGEPFASSGCGGVCSLPGAGLFSCNIDVNGSYTTQDIVVVEDYSGTSGEAYSAWGHLDDGNTFCCYFDDDPYSVVAAVRVDGSDTQADHIYFNDDVRNVETAQVYAYAYIGADYIEGSDYSGVYNLLEGDAGADTITGLADDDIYGRNGADSLFGGGGADGIWGGNDNDTMLGGAGNDDMYGEAGDDSMDGEGQDDYMEGGAGHDGMSGSGGVDVMWGGAGSDDVCGGTGTGDSINGDGSGAAIPPLQYDDLWSPDSGASSPTGSVVGAASHCGHTTHGTSWAGTSCGSAPCCNYDLTTRPANCP